MVEHGTENPGVGSSILPLGTTSLPTGEVAQNDMSNLFSLIKSIKVSQLWDWQYLIRTDVAPIKYSLVIVIILFSLIVVGFISQFFVEKKSAPRFYKDFLKRIGDVLIYIPLLLIFLVGGRYLGIEGLSRPIYLEVCIAVWLIWILFLLYCQIAILPKYWRKYNKVKQEEKYLKYAKNKGQRKN